jgi:hypothetical protein
MEFIRLKNSGRQRASTRKRPNHNQLNGVDMASTIASHLREKTQELNEATLALNIVIELYMASSRQNINDMIYIMNHLIKPVTSLSDDINTLMREATI